VRCGAVALKLELAKRGTAHVIGTWDCTIRAGLQPGLIPMWCCLCRVSLRALGGTSPHQRHNLNASQLVWTLTILFPFRWTLPVCDSSRWLCLVGHVSVMRPARGQCKRARIGTPELELARRRRKSRVWLRASAHGGSIRICLKGLQGEGLSTW
jgi:hypothetical protein